MANFHAAVIAISIIAATSIGYPSLIAGPNWGFGTSSFLSSMVLGCLAAVPLIGTHHVLESSITPSCRAFHWTRIRTTDALFHTLGTRRNHKRQQPSEQHHKQTETHVVILVLTALGILTSTAEECVFRILLPSLLVATAAPSILALDTTTTTTILSILISAVVYGMFHYESSARASENCGTITGQCGMALYQSLLLSLTGTIVPCIVSHLLYELHVHVETWHTANTQLDYIQEQQQKQQMYDDNDSFGSIMQTFFYGFDREQVGTLSESDVQRAVSFAFRNEIVVPSMNEVRQHMKQFHSTRFNLPDFVNLLSDLYAKYGRKTS
jgi:membrane protease YdiL (CAAX protease family)